MFTRAAPRGGNKCAVYHRQPITRRAPVLPTSHFTQLAGRPHSLTRSLHFSSPVHAVSYDMPMFPSVRLLAQLYNIDLSKIKGTGPKQRVLKGDVLAYIKSQNLKPAPAHPTPTPATSAPTRAAAPQPKPVSAEAKYEDIPASNMRQVIANRLTKSKTTIPHSYASISCNIDKLMELRKQLNATTEQKVSVNDFLIRACALALRDVPEANCIWDDKKQEAVQQKSIDISVAVALESGLITPIVVNAASKGLATISAEMKDLVSRARQNKLQLHEFQGGSFCISNLGMFGISEFSAVINPPQAMILAVGGTKQKVVADTMKLQTITSMTVTLSYDTRAVTDELAAKWLQAFQTYIETPQLMIL